MNINDIVGAQRDLFLDRLMGGILWITNQNPNTDIPAKSLSGCILFWNRKEERSMCVAKFGLN